MNSDTSAQSSLPCSLCLMTWTGRNEDTPRKWYTKRYAAAATLQAKKAFAPRGSELLETIPPIKGSSPPHPTRPEGHTKNAKKPGTLNLGIIPNSGAPDLKPLSTRARNSKHPALITKILQSLRYRPEKNVLSVRASQARGRVAKLS